MLGIVALVYGCATPAALPPGVASGRFATFNCEGGKSFQARWAEDGKTVRVRGHHGAAELSPAADGAYDGEGYRLSTRGEGAVALSHGGKPYARGCKAL